MPDPYEWVDEPAFETEYDPLTPPRYRVVQSTHPWVTLSPDPWVASQDLIQKAFEASFVDAASNINPPQRLHEEDWASAIHPDVSGGSEWWRFMDDGVVLGPSWVAYNYAVFDGEVPTLSRQTSFVNVRLDGDIGGPPVDELPETPDWATLEVTGGQATAIEVDVLVVTQAGGFGPRPYLPVPPPMDDTRAWGQWLYRVTGTRGGSGAGGDTSEIVQAIARAATPDNVEISWDRSDPPAVVSTDDGPIKPGGDLLPPGPEGDEGAVTVRVTIDYHVEGGSLVSVMAGPQYVHDPHQDVANAGKFEDVPPEVAVHTYVRGMNIIAVHHLPWRWRWVPKGLGLTRLRQRQTLPGSDSWPLRQRQNGAHTGSWPLRQRQRGV